MTALFNLALRVFPIEDVKKDLHNGQHPRNPPFSIFCAHDGAVLLTNKLNKNNRKFAESSSRSFLWLIHIIL
jgi:hypothetical protein